MNAPWPLSTTSTERLRDIPDVQPDGANVTAVVRALREAVQIFRGYRGDALDRAITERRAVEIGLIDPSRRPIAGGTIVLPGAPTGGPGTDPTPDLTEPPTPTGLTVAAGFTTLIIECDPQTYTMGHGHDRTVVYGAKWALDDPTPPTFPEAVRLYEFLGTVSSYSTDPETRWCIWIKWQTKDGILSVAAAGGANGFQATTAYDVGQLLDALAGQITSGALHPILNSRINLIDGPETMPGSVNNLVREERLARISGDNGVESRAGQYTVDYAYAKTSGIALAGSVTTLQSQVNSPTSGNNPTYALLQTEMSTRATLDGDVRALYTARVEVSSGGRTLVGGFGLAGTALAGQGPTIEFGVIANRFWVGAPAGSGINDSQLFTVQTTAWTDGGVTRPAGVYIDAAYIRNLSALYATIGTLIADQIIATDISVSNLVTGTFRVGASMQSTSFVSGPGGTGFRFDGNGNFEATNAILRGTVVASAGAIGGITIGSNYLRSTNHETTGFQLLDNGSATFGSGAVFRGAISVGSNPTISGTTMTGSGAVINADGTFAFGTAAGNITYNGSGAPVLNGFTTPVASLSTYSVTFTADSTGVIDSPQVFSVTLFVRNGTTDEAPTWTFAVSSRSDASLTTGGSGSTMSITGMGAGIDAGWVEFNATRSGYTTQGPMRVNVSKIKRAVASSGPVTLLGRLMGSGSVSGPGTGVVSAAGYVELRPSGAIFANPNAGVGEQHGSWFTPNNTTTPPGVSHQAMWVMEGGDTAQTQVSPAAFDIWGDFSSGSGAFVTVTAAAGPGGDSYRSAYGRVFVRRKSDNVVVCAGDWHVDAQASNGVPP